VGAVVMTEFELYFDKDAHAYGAVVRREGMEAQVAHDLNVSNLKTWLGTFGFWYSINVPTLVLEAGAKIIYVLPCDGETVGKVKLRKADF